MLMVTGGGKDEVINTGDGSGFGDGLVYRCSVLCVGVVCQERATSIHGAGRGK